MLGFFIVFTYNIKINECDLKFITFRIGPFFNLNVYSDNYRIIREF